MKYTFARFLGERETGGKAMLKTAYPGQQQVPNIVKIEPKLKRLRLSRWLMLIGGSLWFLGIAVDMIVSLVDKNSHFPGSFLSFYGIFFCAYLVFTLFYAIRLVKFWERLERRRQMAAGGDQRLLAAEQPRPDANALPLPTVLGQPSPVTSDFSQPTTVVTTVVQRPNWTIFLVIFGVVFLAIIIFAVVFLLFFPTLFPPLPHHRALPSAFVFIAVAVFVVLMLLYCGLLFGVMYFRARQHLIVTETGLIMFGFRTVHSVSWQEAKLFAIDGIFGARRYPHPSIFELSSANAIVRWSWLRRSNLKVLFIAQPLLSEEDYNRQMQSLLSLIAARTGLPLYDLRDKPHP